MYTNYFRVKSVIVSRTSNCSGVWCFIQQENAPPIDVYTEKKFYAGYALDGTKCGDDSMCYAGQCIPTASDYSL